MKQLALNSLFRRSWQIVLLIGISLFNVSLVQAAVEGPTENQVFELSKQDISQRLYLAHNPTTAEFEAEEEILEFDFDASDFSEVQNSDQHLQGNGRSSLVHLLAHKASKLYLLFSQLI